MDRLVTTEQEKIYTYIDAGVIADVATSEAMDLSWEEGLTEIETFFDVDAYVEDSRATSDSAPAAAVDGEQDGGAGEKGVAGETAQDTLTSPVEEEEAAVFAPVQEVAATPAEKEAVYAEEEGMTDERSPDDIAPAAPDGPLGDPEPMDVEHVTAPAERNDDTDTAPPEQPHFTDSDRAASGADENAQVGTAEIGEADAVKTRSRQNSMNIAFIVNKEDEGAQTANTETTNEAEEATVERQRLEVQQTSCPAPETQSPELHKHGNATEEASSPASNTLPVLAQKTEGADPEEQADRSAPTPSPISASSPSNPTPGSSLPARPAEPTPIKSPDRLNTPVDTDMAPAQDSPAALHPPSSEGKSSLMDEMRREEQDTCPDRRTSSVATKSAIGDDEETEDEDAEGSEDEEFRDAPSSPVSFKERLEEMRNAKEASEAEAVDNEANEQLELELERKPERAVEAGVEDDRDEIVKDADSETEFQVLEDAEDYPGADADDGDVNMEDLPAEAESQATEPSPEKTEKGARTRKTAATARPQTRRGSKAVANEQPATIMAEHEQDSPAPAPAVQDESSTADDKQEDAPIANLGPDLSEDEPAASSPRTIPRKRKASSGAMSPGTILATAVKKAKTVAFASQDEVIDTDAPAGGPAARAEAVREKDACDAKPKYRKRTKAEIRASKQPKQRPRKSGPHHAVGVKELRGLGLSAALGTEDNGGSGGDAAGDGGNVTGGGSESAGGAAVKKEKKNGGTQDSGSGELKEVGNMTFSADGQSEGNEDGDEEHEVPEEGALRKRGRHNASTRELKELGNTTFSAKVDEEAAVDGTIELAGDGPPPKEKKQKGSRNVGSRELKELGAAPEDGVGGKEDRRRSARISVEAQKEQGKGMTVDVSKAVAAKDKGKKDGKK